MVVIFSSQLSNFSILFYYIHFVIFALYLKPPKVRAPAFGWGVRSHFSHWVFGFSYQVVHRIHESSISISIRQKLFWNVIVNALLWTIGHIWKMQTNNKSESFLHCCYATKLSNLSCCKQSPDDISKVSMEFTSWCRY